MLGLPTGFRVLTETTYSVVVALVPYFHPVRSEFPDAMSVGVPKAVDDILAMLDEPNRAELLQLLGLVENALPNFLFQGVPKPFTKQGEIQQAVTMEGWRTSRIALRRTGFLALRTLMISAYYGNPSTWAAVGYSGPPPGIYDAQAPRWTGGSEPRPLGNGTYIEERNSLPEVVLEPQPAPSEVAP
jgi:hypothetical protein